MLYKNLKRKHKHQHKHHAQKTDEKEEDDASIKDAQNEEIEFMKKKGEREFADKHINEFDGLYHSPDGARHFHSAAGEGIVDGVNNYASKSKKNRVQDDDDNEESDIGKTAEE